MPGRKTKGGIRRIVFFPLILLLVLLVVVYNPVSVRLLTVGTALYHGLDVGIFYRLISTESKFRSFAVSPSNAIGLGQVKESTAQYIHVKHRRGMLFIPSYNLSLSARYLIYLQKRFNNNWSLVLAAYNWGENNVSKRMRGIAIDPGADYRHRFADVPETYQFLHKILPSPKKP